MRDVAAATAEARGVLEALEAAVEQAEQTARDSNARVREERAAVVGPGRYCSPPPTTSTAGTNPP